MNAVVNTPCSPDDFVSFIAFKLNARIAAADKRPCRCDAYSFPHRRSGGSCQMPKVITLGNLEKVEAAQ